MRTRPLTTPGIVISRSSPDIPRASQAPGNRSYDLVCKATSLVPRRRLIGRSRDAKYTEARSGCEVYEATRSCTARASGPSAVTRINAMATTASVQERM